MACRVLHVIPAVATRYGGPSTAALGMCVALRAAGTSTLLATTDADGPGRLAVAVGEVQTYGAVPVIFFRRHGSESFKWSGQLEAWVRHHIRDFDVVHIHAVFSHSSLAAGRASRAAHIPYIVRPLGALDPWSLSRHRLRKQVLFRLGVHELLAGAAAIQYTSDAERRLAEAGLPWLPRGVTVPLAVDEELFGLDATERSKSAPYVLVVSRLDAKKGIDVLITAFQDVVQGDRFQGWTLVIAGDGDASYVSRLHALADAGDAHSRIVFRGWVDGAERLALFRDAGLFVLPSHQENFGIAIVEAMAASVPVIVSPGVNLADDIASAAAGWVTEREPAALSDVLRLAMADPVERARRGTRARELAQPFRWAVAGRNLRALYDEILDAGTPAALPSQTLVETGSSSCVDGRIER